MVFCTMPPASERRLQQAYGAEMNDSNMKRAQIKWQCTIIFDTRRADRPPPPRRLFLRASTVGRPCHRWGRSIMFIMVGFHGMPRCLLSYFSTAKLCHFIASWAKKLADKPFLNKYTETVLSRESSMHSVCDTGLNTNCYLLCIPD